MKTKVQRIALTAGIVWGGMMFVVTLASVYSGYASAFLTAMAGIYPGYQITLFGSLIGLAYGFLDAFIGVYITYWVYKKLGK